MKKITLKNDFHNTETAVVPKTGGGALVERGPQGGLEAHQVSGSMMAVVPKTGGGALVERGPQGGLEAPQVVSGSKGFRHFGIAVENIGCSIDFFRKAGFFTVKTGSDVIDGEEVRWVKMSNGNPGIYEPVTIELIEGGEDHIALTVEKVDPKAYYYQSPTGHKIQYGRVPSSGMLVEYVEEPEEIDYNGCC